MIKSQAFYLATVIFAIVSIFSVFYGMFLTTSKISENSHENLLTEDNSPWFERRSKVIFILADNLRFDYLLPVGSPHSNDQFKQNKYFKLIDMLQKDPEHTVLLKTFADSPTLTVTRIPCMVTGNIPSKINSFLAFGSLPTEEDNVLRQLKLNGMKTYLSGDTLWNDYFSQDLNVAPSIRTFDIKDMDVDGGTITYVKDKIKDGDFDMLIGHMLVADHMAHSYGIADYRVAEAIKRIDDFIQDVVELMDDETILLIMGDHGSDKTGDHGHDSVDETTTAVVAYHKKGFQKNVQKNLSALMKGMTAEDIPMINQVDMVPTMAMLTGTPIPFSNLGQMVDDLYPIGDYPGKDEKCPNAAFEAQLAKDNYLNHLQIRQYIRKSQHRFHLYSWDDLRHLKVLTHQIEEEYNDITKMIKKGQHCDPEFHNKVVNLVLKCQESSEKSYKLVRNKSSYDSGLIIEGIVILLLIMVIYLLIIQYIYRFGYQEKNASLLSIPKFFTKKRNLIQLVFFFVTFGLVYHQKRRYAYPIVASTLYSAVCVCGSLILTLFKKTTKTNDIQQSAPNLQDSQTSEQETPTIGKSNNHLKNPQELKQLYDQLEDTDADLEKSDGNRTAQRNQQQATPLFINELDNHLSLLPSTKLFIFQNPLYSLVALSIAIYTIYLIHVKNFYVLNSQYSIPYTPYIAALGITYRLSNYLSQYTKPIMVTAFVLCVISSYMQVDVSSLKLRMALGLLLIVDWIYCESKYIVQQLNTSRIWGVAHMTCMAVLILYQAVKQYDNYWVEIVIPRTVWAILAGIIIFGRIFKIGRLANKRNAQACLVLFLVLMRKQKELLPFAVFLTFMRINNHFFLKVQVKNYLYPIVLAFLSYLMLFATFLTDYLIPANFVQAFIGLHNFNPIISPFIFFVYNLSSFILATVFLSYHHQALDFKYSEGLPLLSSRKQGNSTDIDPLEYSKVIRKRNIVPFVFYYSVIMLSASIKVFVFKDFHYEWALEKFILDGVYYIFIMGCSYFLF